MVTEVTELIAEGEMRSIQRTELATQGQCFRSLRRMDLAAKGLKAKFVFVEKIINAHIFAEKNMHLLLFFP